MLLLCGLAAGCGAKEPAQPSESETLEEKETESAAPQENGLFAEPAEYVIQYYSGGDGETEPVVLESLIFLPEGYCQFMSPVRSYWPAGRYFVEGDRLLVSLAETMTPHYFWIQEDGIVPLDSCEGFWRAGTYLEKNSGEMTYSREQILENCQSQPWSGWEMDPDSVFSEMREYAPPASEAGASGGFPGGSFVFAPGGYCYYRAAGAEWSEWPVGAYILGEDEIVIQFEGDSAEAPEQRTVLKLRGEELEAQTEREGCWAQGTVWERNEEFSSDQVSGYLYWDTSAAGIELGNYWLWNELMGEEKE